MTDFVAVADVPIEQARARGRTVEQICAELDVTAEKVRQVFAMMDAAIAGDEPDVMGEPVPVGVDEVAVERIMSGSFPPRATSAERIEAVRRLAGSGLNDSQIAARFGNVITANGVMMIRSRAGIPSPIRHDEPGLRWLVPGRSRRAS